MCNLVLALSLAVVLLAGWLIGATALQFFFRRFRKRCPQCASGRLEMRNWIRATCENEKGETYPDSWSYFECDQCHSRLKVYYNGYVEEPDEEEWKQHCDPGPYR